MTNSATPLLLPRLKELESQGLNRNALMLIQMRNVNYAFDLNADPKDVLRFAQEQLPKGMAIIDSYSRALVQINKSEVKDLEHTAQHLQWIEGHLERQYAKAIAKDLPLGQFAEQQGEIAKTYAGLIESARDLEDRGVVAMSNSSTLQSIAQRSDGPLGAIYDKAHAILNSTESNKQTQKRQVAA